MGVVGERERVEEGASLLVQSEINDDHQPAAVPAKRTRRKMPGWTRRLIFIILGLFVLAASVLGFYFTSDAFDERRAVLVAARRIESGQTISDADLAPARVIVGAIPHVEWTAEVAGTFVGKVALQPIPQGGLITHDMVTGVEAVPVGVELEVIVPLDLVLATGGVSEGEMVLLVDPGVEPVEGDPGRPRRVVRPFRLTNFDGSQMRLFLPPEEWAEWEALLSNVGGALLVVDVGVDGDHDEMALRLDAVWEKQWSEALQEVALAATDARLEAGPGELEVVVPLDSSLAASGVSEGDLVLLIDPGAKPRDVFNDEYGRPRSVIRSMRLENYSEGQMRMLVSPEEWLYWRSLSEDLGAAPLVLPVASGTDVEDMAERLDSAWVAEWDQSIADAFLGQG